MPDLCNVPTFSDQQILNVLRLSLVNSAIAQEYTINGRTLSRLSATDLQQLIGEYEWRIYRAQKGIFVAASNRRSE